MAQLDGALISHVMLPGLRRYMDAAAFAQNADPTSVNNTFGYNGDADAFNKLQPDAAKQFNGKLPLMGEFGGVVSHPMNLCKDPPQD